MQFTKFAFIAATLLSATMASATVSLNLRDDAADPLIGQGIVVSVNGTTLTTDQNLTCVKSDCGDLLLHSICVAAAVAIKDYKAVLKCFNLSTFDKVCPCVDCFDKLADLLHEHNICK